MGLPAEQLLEPSELLSEFTCAVCLELVDRETAVQTPTCSHIFCSPCIALASNSQCPSCKQKQATVHNLPRLKTSNPPGEWPAHGVAAFLLVIVEHSNSCHGQLDVPIPIVYRISGRSA